MNDDDELGTRVSAWLHASHPARPTQPTFSMATAPKRRRAPLLVSVCAVVALSGLIVTGIALNREGDATPDAGNTTTIAPPAWSIPCLPPNWQNPDADAPEYVGLSFPAAVSLAYSQRPSHIVVAGAGGTCSAANGSGPYEQPIAIVLDSTDLSSYAARIVVAVRAPSGWTPGSS